MKKNKSYIFYHLHLLPEKQIGLHRHTSWEFSWVKCGSGKRVIGDTSVEFTDKEVVLLPPDVPHCWLFEKKGTNGREYTSCVSVIFDETFLDRCSRSFPELQHNIDVLRNLDKAVCFSDTYAERLTAILEQMCEQTEAEHIASILQLINFSVRFQEEGRIIYAREEQDTVRKRVTDAHNFIMSNMFREVTLTDIAEYTGMSRAAFCVFFKKSTGKTFTDYLNTVRVEHACKLLKHSQIQVSEICYQSGFCSVPYFNRVFKRICGISPTQYRNKALRFH